MSRKLFDNFTSTYHEFVFKDLLPVVLIDKKNKLIVDANSSAITKLNITLPSEVSSRLFNVIKGLSKKEYKVVDVDNKKYVVRLHPSENVGTNYTYVRLFEEGTLECIDQLNTPFFQKNITPMLLVNSNGIIVAYNNRFDEIKAIDAKILINQNIFEHFKCREHESFETIFHVLQEDELMTLSEVTFINGGDINRIYDLVINPVFVDNNFIGAQISFINNRINIDDEENIATIFQLLVRHLNDGVMILTHDFKAVYVNQRYTQITGYSNLEKIGQTIKLIDPKYNDSNQTYLFEERLNHFGFFQGESWIKRKDGNVTPVWLNIFSIYNINNKVYRRVAIIKDLGEISNNNGKFLNLIHKDPLTALYNKFIFIERVSNRLLLKPNETQWIILIDLNNFKPVNDEFGHYVGDKVLASFARKLKQVFLNHLNARYGGDEFLVYFGSNNTEESIKKLIDNLYKEMEEPIVVDGLDFHITFSLGMAKYPDHGKTVYELLQYADDSMYKEKEEGRK